MSDLMITSVVGTSGQPLPIHGTTLGSQWSLPVKQERHDEAEIAELAAKMMEQQKIATLKQQQQLQQTQQNLNRQIVTNGTANQANILNYLTRVNKTNGSLPQIANVNGQHINNNNNNNNNGHINSKAYSNGLPSDQHNNLNGEKIACDEESQKGHFGWTTIAKTYIPYIYRQSERYCAVRMMEMKMLGKYLNCLHSDIYSSCTCVRSYYITEAESRLLNEINSKHCDLQFGRESFTLKDLVVRLSDANKFYQFLDICYRKLMSGSKTPSEKCGFIRINKESVVPYTVRNNEQVVPLFYFEGETENLKQKADNLSGWDLAYLKFCCKVQGIRNELFSSESVAVISLTDIKSYFPNGTEFEDYWPSKVVDSNLLISQRGNGSSVNWTRQPAAPPNIINSSVGSSKVNQQQQQMKRNAYQQPRPAAAHSQHQRMVASTPLPFANAPYPNPLAAAVQALSTSWSLPQAQGSNSQVLHQQTAQLLAAQAQVQAQQQNLNQQRYPNRAQMANLIAASRQQFHTYNNGSMSMQSMNCTQPQQPPPLVRSASQSQAHLLNHASINEQQRSVSNRQQQPTKSTIHYYSQSQPESTNLNSYPDIELNTTATSYLNSNSNTNLNLNMPQGSLNQYNTAPIWQPFDNNQRLQIGNDLIGNNNLIFESTQNISNLSNLGTIVTASPAPQPSDINHNKKPIVPSLIPLNSVANSSNKNFQMSKEMRDVVQKVLSNPDLSTFIQTNSSNAFVPFISPPISPATTTTTLPIGPNLSNLNLNNALTITPSINNFKIQSNSNSNLSNQTNPSNSTLWSLNASRQKSVICSTNTLPICTTTTPSPSPTRTPTGQEVIDLSSSRRLQAASVAVQQQQQQLQQRMVSQLQNSRNGSNSSSTSSSASNSASTHLQRHAAAAIASQQQQSLNSIEASKQRLCVIPDISTATSIHIPPYKVQKVYIDNVMVPCINMKAYNDADQLMTLTDFRDYFFPQVPLEQCKNYIEAIGVEMYKGNRRQVQILIESERSNSENIPLVQVRDVIKYMPQLQYMMRSSQEQPPQKRSRIS